jgi:hypothetical protein
MGRGGSTITSPPPLVSNIHRRKVPVHSSRFSAAYCYLGSAYRQFRVIGRTNLCIRKHAVMIYHACMYVCRYVFSLLFIVNNYSYTPIKNVEQFVYIRIIMINIDFIHEKRKRITNSGYIIFYQLFS